MKDEDLDLRTLRYKKFDLESFKKLVDEGKSDGEICKELGITKTIAKKKRKVLERMNETKKNTNEQSDAESKVLSTEELQKVMDEASVIRDKNEYSVKDVTSVRETVDKALADQEKNAVSLEKVPKKRGRKPKATTESVEEQASEEVPKKRGRKPKATTESVETPTSKITGISEVDSTDKFDALEAIFTKTEEQNIREAYKRADFTLMQIRANDSQELKDLYKQLAVKIISEDIMSR